MAFFAVTLLFCPDARKTPEYDHMWRGNTHQPLTRCVLPGKSTVQKSLGDTRQDHTCHKDFVSNRNINNIFEEASPLLDKLMFIVIGARDFSPEITVHLIGTKVPCFDKVPPPQIPIYRALLSNFGTRVRQDSRNVSTGLTL